MSSPVEGQVETLGPAVVPRLLGTGEPGDVVVLHPGGVPEQPDDRVAGAAGAMMGRFHVETVGEVDVQLPDPAEGVDQEVS